ncbi:hypothetical protein PK28_12560 [Hymenobacter sp. DG25B]|uniref:DUF2750 domain-containing protein n=1 Tax=Hymenobacter sp. DG25B TaxID=1385664 RepID=UPI0005413754|nr:DUF2750 domain-containing protein [Hymenobacter sp. DG25B]AIZ64307.1 hypothetical protein PK28_12560 [Hymenobacter sp. DG25B]
MIQDAATVDAKHQKFIDRICVSEIVWGLKSLNGWAISESNEFDNTELIPFWSDRAYAAACAKNEWSDYTPAEIPLVEFLENWCVGIHIDNGLIGTNMDSNMFCKEIEPLQLILDIISKMNKYKKPLKLSKYESSEDFKEQIQQILSKS